MPVCLCGNIAIFVCVNENCAHFKSLKSRLSYERYYCEDCMESYHDHRPTFIVDKTFEVAQKWINHDSTLENIEKEFKKNMLDYMDLIHHYEDFSEKQQLLNTKSILSQLRELDQVKNDFNYEVRDRDADSITELASKFMIIELLEIKELIRIDFEEKINPLSKLAMIDEKELGCIY